MANRKEYEMLFNLNAQLGANYNKTFKSAQDALTFMQKELQDLSKMQSDIASYQKQQGAIEATRQKLAVLQQQYDNIQKEIQETEGFSSALENRLLTKQQQIDKTTSSLEKQTQGLDRLGNALQEAGVDTGSLGSEADRLGNEMSDLKKIQEDAAESAQNFGETASESMSAAHQAIVAAGVAVALKEIYDELVRCAEASMDFETAITGVDKTTDLTEKELQKMAKSVKLLSTEIPATTDELSAVGEAAGQLGIAKEDLLDFTVVMTELGTSTNLGSEQAASSLAKFANVTGMAAENYDRLGSTIVGLGNNFATTEADIVSMATRLSAAGSLSNLNPAEIMGVATALSSVGIEAEAGGSSVSKLMKDFETMVATGSADLADFATVAGTTADDFARMWEENAVGALNQFIVGLKEVDDAGGSSIATLERLGITETRMSDAVLRLSTSGDLLTRAVDTANTAWVKNTALTDEASKRYATTRSQLEMMKNAYNNVGIAIGDAYNPELREAFAIGTDVFNQLADFIEQNPALVKGIAAFAGIMISATGAVLTLATAVKVYKALNVAALFTGPAGAAVVAVTAVASLTAGLVAMNAAYNENVPSVRELTEAARDMSKTMDQASESYDDTVTETLAAANVAERYIGKLEAMETAGISTNEQAKQYHNTLALLCETVPELAGYIDLETDTIDGGTDALRTNTEAWKENAKVQAQQDYLSSLQKSSTAITLEAEKNSIKLTEAQDGAKMAAKGMDETYRALLSTLGMTDEQFRSTYNTVADLPWRAVSQDVADLRGEYLGYEKQLSECERSERAYTEAIEQGSSATADAEREIALAEEAIRNLTMATDEESSMSDEAIQQTRALQSAITDTTEQVTALTAAYDGAYGAAYESILGQYALWDQAEKAVATSAGSINAALESQASYWQDYNSNLQALGARTSDIEGLSEIIASFADGSKDSVNAIAGMANASDADLSTMVENWRILQEEQQAAAGSVADLKTDFTATMDALQQELAADIEAMDLGAEAAESGKATIEGFIRGAVDMGPRVEEAYARLAKSAGDALSLKIQYDTTTTGGVPVDGSHADGLDYVPYDGYIAELHKGERVLTAHEVQNVTLAPWMMAMMNTATTQNAISAEVGGSGNPAPPIQIQFRIDGNASPETVDQLQTYGEDFAEKVLQVIEERDTDRARRAYL